MVEPTLDQAMEQVVRVLREHCEVQGEPQPDSDLQLDLGLESIGLLTLVAELENHYRVVLDGSAEQPATTVRHVAELVVERLAAVGDERATEEAS